MMHRHHGAESDQCPPVDPAGKNRKSREEIHVAVDLEGMRRIASSHRGDEKADKAAIDMALTMRAGTPVPSLSHAAVVAAPIRSAAAETTTAETFSLPQATAMTTRTFSQVKITYTLAKRWRIPSRPLDLVSTASFIAFQPQFPPFWR